MSGLTDRSLKLKGGPREAGDSVGRHLRRLGPNPWSPALLWGRGAGGRGFWNLGWPELFVGGASRLKPTRLLVEEAGLVKVGWKKTCQGGLTRGAERWPEPLSLRI